MSEHQRTASRSRVWLTPPHILAALGSFDLDPCAATEQPLWAARQAWTKYDDGLKKPWLGRVWLNPPYDKTLAQWLARLADHGNGIALIFARTETQTFFEQVWEKADAFLFLRGRLHFHFPNGTKAVANCGAPSVLVAYGQHNAEALQNCELAGQYVAL